MEYKGKLYGKVGNSYFPLLATSDDFDKLKAKEKTFDKMLEYLQKLYRMFMKLSGHKVDMVIEMKELIKEAREHETDL